MDKNYIKQILRIFFGFCLLLTSVLIFFLDLFSGETGMDAGLMLLNSLLFFGGGFLTIFGIWALPAQKQ